MLCAPQESSIPEGPAVRDGSDMQVAATRVPLSRDKQSVLPPPRCTLLCQWLWRARQGRELGAKLNWPGENLLWRQPCWSGRRKMLVAHRCTNLAFNHHAVVSLLSQCFLSGHCTPWRLGTDSKVSVSLGGLRTAVPPAHISLWSLPPREAWASATCLKAPIWALSQGCEWVAGPL